MSPLVFLLIAFVVSVAGTLALWLRHRSPTTYDSGIRDFQREMQALAPREDERGRRQRDGR
ncbi:MAG: hypothetical protein AB7L84_14680 [Acidimicrobiia bacterium]